MLSQQNATYVRKPIPLLEQTPNVFPRPGTSSLPAFVEKARLTSLAYPGRGEEGGGREGRKD